MRKNIGFAKGSVQLEKVNARTVICFQFSCLQHQIRKKSILRVVL
jgi:hypothetical protein